MRLPLKHLKKRCSEEEKHSGDLKLRVCGANCLEKFRNIMFAEIGRNLARVDQLDEQRQRPPFVFLVHYLRGNLPFVTWSTFFVGAAEGARRLTKRQIAALGAAEVVEQESVTPPHARC